MAFGVFEVMPGVTHEVTTSEIRKCSRCNYEHGEYEHSTYQTETKVNFFTDSFVCIRCGFRLQSRPMLDFRGLKEHILDPSTRGTTVFPRYFKMAEDGSPVREVIEYRPQAMCHISHPLGLSLSIRSLEERPSKRQIQEFESELAARGMKGFIEIWDPESQSMKTIVGTYFDPVTALEEDLEADELPEGAAQRNREALGAVCKVINELRGENSTAQGITIPVLCEVLTEPESLESSDASSPRGAQDHCGDN